MRVDDDACHILQDYNVPFLETSAKSGMNIELAVCLFFCELLNTLSKTVGIVFNARIFFSFHFF